jgi:predicted alpha/beta-hydrolase family hydrolase
MRSVHVDGAHRPGARGYALKFNFPYTGARRRDPIRLGARARYRAVIDAVRSDAPSRHRVVVGGKSLGGRIASHLAAAEHP